MRPNVNKLVKLAMLSAMSIVLMMLIRFPIIPSAPFLEYDPGDIPALIGAFIYGPAAGLVITIIVSLIQAFTVSAGSGWIGALMHIAATGTMVVVAGLIYRRVTTIKGAIIALAAGSISMTLVMVALNLVFTPIFMGVPLAVVKSMLVPAIIPFNLFKTLVNSTLTFGLYKSIGRVLRAEISRAAEEAN